MKWNTAILRDPSHLPFLSAYWFGKQSVIPYILMSVGDCLLNFITRQYIYPSIIKHLIIQWMWVRARPSITRFVKRAIPLREIGLVYKLSLSNVNLVLFAYVREIFARSAFASSNISRREPSSNIFAIILFR